MLRCRERPKKVPFLRTAKRGLHPSILHSRYLHEETAWHIIHRHVHPCCCDSPPTLGVGRHLPSLQHHQEKPKYQKRPKRQEKIRRVKLQGFTRLIFKVIARFSFCPSSEASPILSTAYIHAISKSIQNHPNSVNLQHSFSHGKPLCRSSNFS